MAAYILSCEAGSASESCGPAGQECSPVLKVPGCSHFCFKPMLNGAGHRCNGKKPHHPGKKPHYLLNGVEQRNWWVFGLGAGVGARMIRSPGRRGPSAGHVDQEPGPGFDHQGGQRSPPSATRGAGSTTPQNTLTLRLCWARGRSRTTRRTKRIA